MLQTTSIYRYLKESANHASHVLPVLTLLEFVLAIFGSMFLVTSRSMGDFQWHIERAFTLKQTGSLAGLPHFFYQLTVITTSDLLPGLPPHIQGGIPVLMAAILTSLIIYALLTQQFQRSALPNTSPYIVVALTLIVMTIAPIPLLRDRLGYFSATVYHNPTQNILKLWLLPVSLFALRVINPQPYVRFPQRLLTIAAIAVMITLMTITKPNYTLCLVPAIAVIAFVRLLRRQSIDWWLALFGVGLPAIVVLGVQYLNTYGNPEAGKMAFGFLKFMMTTSSLWQIPLLLLASIAFPIVVFIVFLRRTIQDSYLNLAWLAFIFGALFAYFIYEDGSRAIHGNSLWGAHAGIFVVMYASIAFLAREHPALFALRRWQDFFALPLHYRLILIILGLHVIAGVVLWFGYLTGILYL